MNDRTSAENDTKSIDKNTVKVALHELQRALLKIYGRPGPKILLFGSYARQNQQATSDIDILLLYPETISPGLEIKRIRAILSDLNLRYQVLISVLPANEKEYQRSRDSFWKNVQQDVISIELI